MSPLLSLLTPGRTLILLSNLTYSIGAFVADYSSTHLFNPRWPPHAKFHNGQTITLGTLLALTSSYFVYKSTTITTTTQQEGKEEVLGALFEAAWVASLYCGAGLCAILYPGTAWMDPEFVPKKEEGRATRTQRPIFAGVVALA